MLSGYIFTENIKHLNEAKRERFWIRKKPMTTALESVQTNVDGKTMKQKNKSLERL